MRKVRVLRVACPRDRCLQLRSGFCILASGFHVARVGPHRQQPEERAQQILALRHPRHRVHLQRMQGEQRRQDRAPPKRPRHPPEHQEDQDRIERVKQQVDQVMARRLQPEQLAVQHVGNPGQRMPVGLLAVQPSKGPTQALPRQPGLNLRIVGDIIRIVVIR